MGRTLFVDRSGRSVIIDGSALTEIPDPVEPVIANQQFDAIVIHEIALLARMRNSRFGPATYSFLYGAAVVSGYDVVVLDEKAVRDIERSFFNNLHSQLQSGGNLSAPVHELLFREKYEKVAGLSQKLQQLKPSMPQHTGPIQIRATELQQLDQQNNQGPGENRPRGSRPGGRGNPPERGSPQP